MDRSSDWFRVFTTLTELAMTEYDEHLWCESKPDEGKYIIKRHEQPLVWATLMISGKGQYLAVVCGSVDSKATHYFLTDAGISKMREDVRFYLSNKRSTAALLPETPARLMA